VTGQIIVGRINPDFTGTSGHLTLGEETRPLIFRFLTPEARPPYIPDNHNILIFWGQTLLASCPNKLSVNQLISNMEDEGYFGAVGGKRGGRDINSCEFKFFNEQLTPDQKAIILQAAKALGDKFPCDIAMRISGVRNLRNAFEGRVLVPPPAPGINEADLDKELICMGLTIDGLCFLNFTGSGQACLKAHGKTMTLSIPTNVISADIKPILIKSFGLKLVECGAFFETQSQNALRSVLRAVRIGEETSLATIVQKLAAARRVEEYLERIEQSLGFINEILTAIRGGNLPHALTLMKTNNDKISFGCGEVIDDIFGTIAGDESSFLRMVVVDATGCNPKYEMKLVDEPETRSDKVPKSLKQFADRGGVMHDFTSFMLASNPDLFSSSHFLQQQIQHMFNDEGKDPPLEVVEQYLPGMSEFLIQKGISFENMRRYLSSSLTPGGARGRSKMPSGAPAAVPAEIRFRNALLGARILEGGGRRGEAPNLKPIPMEIISKIVDAGSLDTILRDYNKELIITAFRRAQNSQEDKSLLFKYLSYLSCSIIMWFENNYPDIFSLGDRVWESVISSLILESLPPLYAGEVRALNNMIQVLSGALRPTNRQLEITQRPIEIARWAAASDLYDESFRSPPPSVTVATVAARVAAGGAQTYTDINVFMNNIRRLEDERQNLLQNYNVTRFLLVFAEGGGGMMGGPQGMMGGPPGMMVEVKRGNVSPSKDPPPLEDLVGTRVEYVDERDNSVRSGILTNRLDGNRVYVVTKEGQAGGAGEWVSLEQLVLNQGGGSRRRKTRKKRRRRRKKTRRRRRKKHKRKTRRKR